MPLVGFNLAPIVVKRQLTLDDLRGRSLAVDANNMLYQFLALIRMRDGRPFTDSKGHTTSHLVGPFIAAHVDGKTGRLVWRRYDPPSTKHPARYKTLWQARHATKEDNEKLGQLQFLQEAKMPKRLKVEVF